jgi:hypothetical protein
MMDFMVLALPRSGTTWAANWLTTEKTYCAHDPLWTVHYRDVDATIRKAAGDRKAGISCTGCFLFPEWVNEQPARKLILHRDLDEIQASLSRIEWPLMPSDSEQRLDEIDGWHVRHADLFDTDSAAGIWEYLTGEPFDHARHEQLALMRIEPKLDSLIIDQPLIELMSREVVSRGNTDANRH